MKAIATLRKLLEVEFDNKPAVLALDAFSQAGAYVALVARTEKDLKAVAEDLFSSLDDETTYKLVRGNAIRMLELDRV